MAVFRVQKTQNYTIMSNHHLRNNRIVTTLDGLKKAVSEGDDLVS